MYVCVGASVVGAVVCSGGGIVILASQSFALARLALARFALARFALARLASRDGGIDTNTSRSARDSRSHARIWLAAFRSRVKVPFSRSLLPWVKAPE